MNRRRLKQHRRDLLVDLLVAFFEGLFVSAAVGLFVWFGLQLLIAS